MIAELLRTRAACVSRVLDDARAENPIIDPVIRAELAEMGRIGIGLDAEFVSGLPQAYAEAGTALDLHGAERAVAHLAELDVNAYLRHRADATTHRLQPPLPLDVRVGTLAQTLDAFATADLTVKACARRLGVHVNTIYHRLNRIARLTGCDPRRFTELARLVTALRMG